MTRTFTSLRMALEMDWGKSPFFLLCEAHLFGLIAEGDLIGRRISTVRPYGLRRHPPAGFSHLDIVEIVRDLW